MPLNTVAVGTKLATQRMTVTARRALAFASLFPDVTADELDDAADVFTVVPFVCVTYEWICTKQLRAVAALGLTTQDQLRSVHAGQDTIFHQAIPVGANIRLEGEIEEIRGTRAGAVMSTRLRMIGDDGSRFTTSRVTTIFRGVPVIGASCPAPAPAQPAPIDPAASAIATTSIAIPRGFAHVYTECADIWNPIHTERRAAQAAGLPDIIVHGTALWALAGRQLLRIYGGPRVRLTRLACRFSAMVIPDSTVTLQHQQSSGEHAPIRFILRNAGDEAALSQGVAELAVA